jgi:hypothetical protein
MRSNIQKKKKREGMHNPVSENNAKRKIVERGDESIHSFVLSHNRPGRYHTFLDKGTREGRKYQAAKKAAPVLLQQREQRVRLQATDHPSICGREESTQKRDALVLFPRNLVQANASFSLLRNFVGTNAM